MSNIGNQVLTILLLKCMKRKLAERGNEVAMTKCKVKSETTSESWSIEEDDFIISEMIRLTNLSWKTITKRLNKKFIDSKRSYIDCKNRWKLLTSYKDIWTHNEQLMLLLAFYNTPHNWSHIASLIPNKPFIKNYFVNEVKNFARKIKNDAITLSSCSHFKMIKKLFLLKFIWDEFTNSKCPDIHNVIKATKLKELECEEALIKLKGWKKRELDVNLEKFYYSFISSALSYPDNTFGELLNVRKEGGVKYCWIPFNLNGRELYLLGRYNI